MTDLRYRTNMIVNYLGGMSKWELNVSQKKLIWAIFPTRLFTGARDAQRIALEQTLEIAVVVSRSLLFAQVVAHNDCDALWIQNFQDGGKGREISRVICFIFQ